MPKDRYIIAQIGTFDCKNFGDLLFLCPSRFRGQ